MRIADPRFRGLGITAGRRAFIQYGTISRFQAVVNFRQFAFALRLNAKVLDAFARVLPQALAEAIEALWANKARSRAMGEAGRARVLGLGLSWDRVVETLCR